jgi:hypothetical protein
MPDGVGITIFLLGHSRRCDTSNEASHRQQNRPKRSSIHESIFNHLGWKSTNARTVFATLTGCAE